MTLGVQVPPSARHIRYRTLSTDVSKLLMGQYLKRRLDGRLYRVVACEQTWDHIRCYEMTWPVSGTDITRIELTERVAVLPSGVDEQSTIDTIQRGDVFSLEVTPPHLQFLRQPFVCVLREQHRVIAMDVMRKEFPLNLREDREVTVLRRATRDDFAQPPGPTGPHKTEGIQGDTGPAGPVEPAKPCSPAEPSPSPKFLEKLRLQCKHCKRVEGPVLRKGEAPDPYGLQLYYNPDTNEELCGDCLSVARFPSPPPPPSALILGAKHAAHHLKDDVDFFGVPSHG